jgi:hypothetical protein
MTGGWPGPGIGAGEPAGIGSNIGMKEAFEALERSPNA